MVSSCDAGFFDSAISAGVCNHVLCSGQAQGNYIVFNTYQDYEKYVNKTFTFYTPLKNVDAYNKIVAFSQGRSGMDNSTFNSGLLCIYYLNQAIRTDPGHATTYMKMRAWVSKGIKAEAFYRNVTSGQTVTVNGVTFTVTF